MGHPVPSVAGWVLVDRPPAPTLLVTRRSSAPAVVLRSIFPEARMIRFRGALTSAAADLMFSDECARQHQYRPEGSHEANGERNRPVVDFQ